MTFPERKIVIQDKTKKITNTRAYLLNEKPGKKKPFIFKGYKTEADRIKDTERNNRYLFNLPDPPEKEENNKRIKSLSPQSNKINLKPEQIHYITNRMSVVNYSDLKNIDYYYKNNIILQPEMRFKARTDLERVYDALSTKVDRNNEKDILNRQLKNIDLLSFKKADDYLRASQIFLKNKNKISIIEDEENDEEKKGKGYKILPNPLIQLKEKNKTKKKEKGIYQSPKYYYIPKDDIPWIKKKNLNIEAKGMLEEYHQKTHFKAAEEIAENKINSKNMKLHKAVKSTSFLPILTLNENEKDFHNINDFENEDINYNTEQIELYEKKYNYNPLHKSKNETINNDKMKLLTQLAFTNNNEKKVEIIDENKYDINQKKKLVDENTVLIGNELLYKQSQFDIIANRVLNLCHYYNKKSIHNPQRLKKRNGKLMMTRGLTVEQFEKKYNLEEV
jgi:hypothetical protein